MGWEKALDALRDFKSNIAFCDIIIPWSLDLKFLSATTMTKFTRQGNILREPLPN